MLPTALAAKWLVEEEKRTSSSVSKPKHNSKRQKSSKTKEVSRQKNSEISLQFDEEINEICTKFNLDSKLMKNALDGLINFISTKKSKNDLFGDEAFSLYLQINGIKVLQTHPKIARISLKHCYYPAESDICLIVPDVKGIKNKNHDEHVDFYEKFLSQKGVNNIKKIMTFHEFRTEYETFELKHRLVELYDCFLVDGRISGKTVHKCGKIFYKKNKIPTAIKLNTNVRKNIEVALKKTPLYLHSKGDSFRVKIGHSKMETHELVENIFYLIKGLDNVFPGGFANIRSLFLGGAKGIKIPVYMTLKNKNQVVLPDVFKKPVEEFIGELSTKLNSHVKVKATGEVRVIKVNDEGVEVQKKEKSVAKKSAAKRQKLVQSTSEKKPKKGPNKKKNKKDVKHD